MFKIDFRGIKEALEDMDPKKAVKIMTRTINKITERAEVAMRRKIREEYNIKNDRLKDAITVRKATWTKPEATIRAKGKIPGLQNYDARQTTRGVTVKVTKSGGRKLIAHAFLANMPNGGIGVFMREGMKRLPIKRLFGPDVAGMVNKVGVKAIEQSVNDTMEKTFEHELEYEMGKRR